MCQAIWIAAVMHLSVSVAASCARRITAIMPPIMQQGHGAGQPERERGLTPPVCGGVGFRFATFFTCTVLLSSLLVRFGTVPEPYTGCSCPRRRW